MNLTDQQENALNLLKAGKSMFLTGAAGTGKSTIINQFSNYCQEKNINIQITSTTGISALLIGGTTINSFAGYKTDDDIDVKTIIKHPFKRKNWLSTHTLIIDEISMLKPHVLEKLDEIARIIKGNYNYFGGIQLIGVGDFAQLPPVYKDNTKHFCFESELFNKLFPIKVYLTEIVRQNNVIFQDCLNEIRLNNVSEKTIALLEDRIREPEIINNIKPTLLFSTKKDVNTINKKEIDKLIAENAETRNYTATYTVNKPVSTAQKNLYIDILQKNAQAHHNLTLCCGMQIMVTKNIDVENGICNGTRGVITGFIGNLPKIKLLNGNEIIIDYSNWEFISRNIKGNTIATMKQIPLIPAYALTIHKIQGSTLDCAIIDVGNKIFEHGQTYTALSRVKNIENLYLVGFDKDRIICDKRVIEFYRALDRENNQ